MAAVRPGYVYIMSNPSLIGWRKVGHTYRPPHRRAEELSDASIPTAFDVDFARFFWDAFAAEQKAHKVISCKFGAGNKKKEFFNVPLEDLREIVSNLPEVLRTPYGSSSIGERWEDTLEGREELWAWAEDDWNSMDPALKRKGWRTMESLSAGGWAEGSWRLSDLIMKQSQDIKSAEKAAWVLDAARVQGLSEAALRAAWLRSWSDERRYFGDWVREVDRLPDLFGEEWTYWPTRVTETLDAEMHMWNSALHRRLNRPWSERLFGVNQ